MALKPPDPFHNLRAELEAALIVVGDQVHGMEAFLEIGLSVATTEVMQEQLDIRTQRMGFLQAFLRAMDALIADGYPTLDDVNVSAPVHTEITKRLHEIEASADVFDKMLAAMGKIGDGHGLGPPVD